MFVARCRSGETEGFNSHVRVGADVLAVLEPQRRHAPQVRQLHQDEAAHLRVNAAVSSSLAFEPLSSSMQQVISPTGLDSTRPDISTMSSNSGKQTQSAHLWLVVPRRMLNSVPVKTGQHWLMPNKYSVEQRRKRRALHHV